jgi:hypothetical protein
MSVVYLPADFKVKRKLSARDDTGQLVNYEMDS